MKLKQGIDKFLMWGEQKYSSGTLKAYESHLNDFCLMISNKKLNSISLEDVLKYQKNLQEKGLNASTIFRYTSAVRSLFRLTYREGYSCFDPSLIPAPKYSSISWRAVEDDEFKKIVKAVEGRDEFIKTRNKLILYFLYSTGVRISELTGIKTNSINVKTREAIILTKKANKTRRIIWNEDTNKILRKYLLKHKKVTDSEYLIINSSGKSLAVRQIQRLLKEACSRAGLDQRIVPHSFRHAFGMRAVTKNMNIRHLQVLMGHESITSTQTYMSYKEPAIKADYDKVFN